MAKKKPNIAESIAGKDLKKHLDEIERGEFKNPLDKVDVIREDPKPPAGVEFEPIDNVAVDLLKPHPANKALFDELPEAERARLKEDIKERGVLVPIVAKKNDKGELVILSGHRRADIARELGRVFVPVQVVKGELTEEQEREYLAKDNVLRRHLTPGKRRKLIVALYGDELDKDRRGGDRKSEEAKIKSENFTFDRENEPLPEKIERETGIKKDTSKRDLAHIRKERKGETPPKPPKPKPGKLDTVKKHCQNIIKALQGADEKTEAEAIRELLDTIERINGDLAGALSQARNHLNQ